MFQIYLTLLIVLLSSCQSINSDLNNTNKDSQEVITDHKPFTDIPPDVFPAEGKMEILYQISLGGQTGLGTTANLEINLGEAGKVSVSQKSKTQWHTINLKHSYQRPVVIMQPLSYNAGSPSLVRIKDVTSNSFKFQIDEWDYLNGSHSTEEVSYIVLEEGVWSFKNGVSFEVGKKLVNHNFKQINLQLNLTNPVILTQSQTYNGAPAITTRQRPSGNGFEVRLQEEQAADGIHGKESVGYVAASQGQDRLGSVAITAGIKENVSHNFSTINFGFGTVVEDQQPIFLAGMQSYNGADPAGVRYKNLTTSEVKVRVEEEKSADTETLHANEDIGYLLLAEIPPVTSAWTKQFGTLDEDGTASADEANDVVTDGNDNVIVVGSTLGDLFASNLGGHDAFLVKYNSEGNVLWTKQFGTSSSDHAMAVSIDTSNNIVVAGYTTGALTTNNAGGIDVIVRKYSSVGTILWTKQFGTSANDDLFDVVVGNDDSIVLVGRTKGVLDGINMGGEDAFLRKYSTNGNVIWTKQFGTTGNDFARAVEVDSVGNVIVGAQTQGSLEFGVANAGGSDIVLRKYSSTGTILWTKQFGTSANDWPQGIAVNSVDDIVIAGAISSSGSSDVFVRKYGQNGNSLWLRQFGTDNLDWASDVTINNLDEIIIVGETWGNLAKSNPLAKADVFLHQLNGAGNASWTYQFGTVESDNARALTTDTANGIILVGKQAIDLPVGKDFDIFSHKYVYP